MRISDWSSDVCSSDLQLEAADIKKDQKRGRHREFDRAERPRLTGEAMREPDERGDHESGSGWNTAVAMSRRCPLRMFDKSNPSGPEMTGSIFIRRLTTTSSDPPHSFFPPSVTLSSASYVNHGLVVSTAPNE